MLVKMSSFFPLCSSKKILFMSVETLNKNYSQSCSFHSIAVTSFLLKEMANLITGNSLSYRLIVTELLTLK